MVAAACAGVLATSTWLTTPLIAHEPQRMPELPSITLSAEMGYGGYTKGESWTPIRIYISSTENVDGELVVEDTLPENSQDKIYTPVTLIKNARRQYELFAPPGRNAVIVKFYTNGVELSSTPVTARQLANTDRLVVVSSEPLDGFNFLGDLRTPLGGKTFLAQMRLDQLPDHVASLNAIDVLILSNIDSSILTEAQKASIRAWIVTGGHLITGGGPGARLTVPPWGDLMPARTGAATNAGQGSLANLNAFVAPNRIEPIAEVPTATTNIPLAPLQIVTQDAQVLVTTPNNTPLIVRRTLGRGIVDQLAFDVSLAPYRDWIDRAQVFVTLFNGRVGQTYALGPLRAEDLASKAAKSIPAVGLPPIWIIVLALAIYIMVIGPLNFSVLRRFNKLMWAWVTIPIIILLFSAIGFIAGSRLRSSQVLANRVSFVFGDARMNEGFAQEFVGVYALRTADLSLNTQRGFGQPIRELSTSSSYTTRPLAPIPMTMRQTEPNRLEKVGVNSNEIKTFFVRGEGVLPKISADLNVSPVAKTTDSVFITGVIKNTSNATLEDCTLIASDIQKFPGKFAPEGVLDVNLEMSRHRLRPVIPPIIERYALSSGYTPSSSFGGFSRGSRFLYSTGDYLNNVIIDWRDFSADKTLKDTDTAILAAAFGDARSQAGLGATLACWESINRTNVQFDSANYWDRGLRMWEVPVKGMTVQAGMAIPADLYNWNVLSSSTAATINDTGMSLEAGKHVLSFTPWVPIRTTTNSASVQMSFEFGSNSSRLSLRESSVWLFDWQLQKYARVRQSINVNTPTFNAPGNYVSPLGEMRMLIDVGAEVLALNDMRVSVTLQ
jgi:hypothetical protein